MRIVAGDGRELVAEFVVEETRNGEPGFDIVLRSRSGGRNSPNARNPDYFEALEEILSRLSEADAEIRAIEVDSTVTRSLTEAERLLDLEFPIRPSSVDDLGGLRRRITSAQRTIGRSPDAGPQGGNNHKQIRITVAPCGAMPDSGAARDRLQGPVAGMVLLAEEVDPTGHYREGAVTQILVNAYERDPAARRACINHYGTVCSICGFDFETVYGDIAVNRNGERFIHVHHLRDLASLGGSTNTDPIEDLRPVCANCHAMLHTDVPAHDINWLRIRVVSRRAD